MTVQLEVTDHEFEGQHIREYPGALASSQEDVVKLHAKQYTPRAVAEGKRCADLTVIAFHANGFPKEVYEPFFEELCTYIWERHGAQIGSIWIADQAFQGSSAALNRDIMGNEPNWFDHSRDVLGMVNTFRKHMKRPLFAIGHSMGGAQAVALAHYHPRLFTGLILIDPSVSQSYARTLHLMLKYALNKPDKFPSRQSVEQAVCKDPFFKSWDHRARQCYIDSAFRESPCREHPEGLEPTTSKHVEILSLSRPNLDRLVPAPDRLSPEQHYVNPDLDPTGELQAPVYNPFTKAAVRFLPHLRPATLYVLGKGSRIVPPEMLDERTRMTGSGVGGSGGVERGAVKQVTVKGGHFLPMTNPAGTAEEVANWLAGQLRQWQDVEDKWMRQWNRKSLQEKQSVAPDVADVVKKWNGKPWSVEASAKL